MKTTLILIALFLIGGTGALLATHPFKPSTTTEITVFNDITEANGSLPLGADDIVPLYGLDIWSGRTFHLLNLSDVSYGKETGASLTDANQWLSNVLERKREVLGFQKELSRLFTVMQTVPEGKKQSSLYLPIANELTALHESTAHRKILILASDLMENTAAISFYSPATIKLLQTKQDSITSALERIQSLPDLRGIEIYLVYYPKTPEEDSRYQLISAFYKNLFEKKGATVSIGSLPHPEN